MYIYIHITMYTHIRTYIYIYIYNPQRNRWVSINSNKASLSRELGQLAPDGLSSISRRVSGLYHQKWPENWIKVQYGPTKDLCSGTQHGYRHRCPFPIGWLINRGVCLPLQQQVNDDRWYTKPAPLVLPKGHYWLQEGVPKFDRSSLLNQDHCYLGWIHIYTYIHI